MLIIPELPSYIMLAITCSVVASVIFQKIVISHCCNAFGPHFRGQEAKRLQNSKWSTWTLIYKTVNAFEIGWAVIEKLWPKYDPKLTHLCDLLPTGSRLWRHTWRKYKDYLGYVAVHFEDASFSTFQDFTKDHFVTVKSVTAAVAWKQFTADPK